MPALPHFTIRSFSQLLFKFEYFFGILSCPSILKIHVGFMYYIERIADWRAIDAYKNIRNVLKILCNFVGKALSERNPIGDGIAPYSN
jgi:hypothetical protein